MREMGMSDETETCLGLAAIEFVDRHVILEAPAHEGLNTGASTTDEQCLESSNHLEPHSRVSMVKLRNKGFYKSSCKRLDRLAALTLDER